MALMICHFFLFINLAFTSVSDGKLLSRIKQITGKEHKNLRVLYHYDNGDKLAVASVTRLEKNFCILDYDRVYKIVKNSNSIELLWDAGQNKKEIIENIGDFSIVKHRRNIDFGNGYNECENIFEIKSIKLVKKNSGSNYNPFLRSGNFVVVTNDRPAAYFFANDFKKLLGSFSILENRKSLFVNDKVFLEASISSAGTIVSLIRKPQSELDCSEEWDLESSSLLRSHCFKAKAIKIH